MKRFLIATTALALLAGSAGTVTAQPRHDDHRYDRHDNRGGNHHNWRKGGRIEQSDWRRGQRVDYRRYKLRAPPRGYEWRRVDNNFVLAAATTGLIASILAAQ